MRIRKQQAFEGFTAMSMASPVLLEDSRTVASCSDDSDDLAASPLLYPHPKLRRAFNWLDKLRAAKGFPLEADVCMEDALVPRDPSSKDPPLLSSSLLASNSCFTTLRRDSVASGIHFSGTKTVSNGMEELVYADNVSCRSTNCHFVRRIAEDGASEDTADTSVSRSDNNLFADIFAMDDPYKLDKKSRKGPLTRNKRKQEKPRLCPISAVSSTSEVNNTFFDILGNEANVRFVQLLVKPLEEKYQDMPKEEPSTDKNPLEQNDIEGLKIDLSAEMDDFENLVVSEIEILVIDTSLADWKVPKILVKRGESWETKQKQNLLMIGNNAESNTKSSNMANCDGKDDMYPDTVSDKLTSQNKMEQMVAIDQLGRNNLESSELKFTKSRKRKELPGFNHSYEKGSVQKTAPQSDLRPCKKRIDIIRHNEATAKKDAKCLSLRSADLAPDHPANQPRESLTHSVYQVFVQAGKAGLTAREAVSRILERGLPGLHEGGVVPRVEVLKIISNSPYFMLLEESKYILCSALVGDEEHERVSSKDDEQNSSIEGTRSESVKGEKQQSISQHWAAWAAIRRARTTGKTRRKPSLNVHILETPCHETCKSMSALSCKKRLKFMKQEVAGLGNPCNRSDGKGWHCPLRAKVGYLLCDHHLNRLRIKSHIKSKMLSTMNKDPSAVESP